MIGPRCCGGNDGAGLMLTPRMLLVLEALAAAASVHDLIHVLAHACIHIRFCDPFVIGLGMGDQRPAAGS